MLVVLRPPDYITDDQGSNYVSLEILVHLDAAGVTLLGAPIENPGTIGVVERYYAPLRAAYERISGIWGSIFATKIVSVWPLLH